MWTALSLEVGKLEVLRTTGWLTLSVVTMIVGAALTAGGLPVRGVIVLGFGISCALWFSVVRIQLHRGRWVSALGWGTILIENTAPWLYYAAIGVSGDVVDAHQSFGPSFLYLGCLVVGMMKLWPRYALITGATGVTQYLLFTFLILEPRYHGPNPAEFGLVREVIRCAMFAGAAVVCAWVTHGLRGAMGGLVRTVRAKDLFGKYKLEREIASGGMGIVWLATYCPEGGFQRPAAVKLLHAHLARDLTFLDAFRREAELGARLVHSHIVQTFDFGIVDDRTFLAMEFVDGPTLRDIMLKAAEAGVDIPPAVAGAITRGILAGLGYAHAGARDADGHILRVIHRDIAPSNILIAKGGCVKVTDFGIARALRGRLQEETQTVAGHIDHMAPEQASAAALDERSDLFCVGILLWEMLMGTSLFRRNNDAASLLAITIGEIPAPSSRKPGLGAWDLILARALDRAPLGRFQTASEMAAAIGRVDGEGGEEVIARFLRDLQPAAATPVAQQTDTQATLVAQSAVSTRVDVHEEPTHEHRGGRP